jgi:hypothetical protein
MKRFVLAVGLALGIFAISYAALNEIYGRATIHVQTQRVVFENYGKSVTIENETYGVQDFWLEDNHYKIVLENLPSSPLLISYRAYEIARSTAEPVATVTTTITETKPINVLPIAAVLGATAGISTAIFWIGYRKAWGDAVPLLLEKGLYHFTIRDVQILGYAMRHGEFTIPELERLTRAPKLVVWRSVQKLLQSGLIESTDQTRPAARGLGGRGKPSRVYRYVGPKPPTSA